MVDLVLAQHQLLQTGTAALMQIVRGQGYNHKLLLQNMHS